MFFTRKSLTQILSEIFPQKEIISKSTEIKQKLYINRLKIILKSRINEDLNFTCKNMENRDKIGPWKHFIKWYFSRESSEYLFNLYSSATLIKRDDIQLFQITVEEQN